MIMEASASIWLVFLLLLIDFSVAETNADRPEYMKIFEQHQQWEGHYMYQGVENFCMFFIHSEHYKKENGLLATFKDRHGSTIEMEGEPVVGNEYSVTFQVFAIFHDGNRFPDNFTFISTLLYKSDNLWNMGVAVTIPNDGTFPDFAMHQSDDDGGPSFETGPKPWHYFLIIGVPLLLAIGGVVGTGFILYWAMKKGYLRHVPKNYKNFNNAAVQYDANSRDENSAVHI